MRSLHVHFHSRFEASLKRQQQYQRQVTEAEHVLEPRFGEAPNRYVMKSIERFPAFSGKDARIDFSSRQKKMYIRTEEDASRVIAWAVAQRIKKARETGGLTQKDLAEKSGIARPNIVRLEKGRHMPTLPTLQKIAKVLNLDLHRLVAQPELAKKEKAEFTEMAERGMGEWVDQLEKEDTQH